MQMVHVCAKLTSKLLAVEEKSLRVEIAHDNLEMVNNEKLLRKVITSDEQCVYGYDP